MAAAVALDAILSGHEPAGNLLLAAGLDSTGGLVPAGSLMDILMEADSAPIKSQIILVPEGAALQLSDWLVRRPRDWMLLSRLCIVEAAHATDALTLCSSSRAPALTRSFALTEAIAARLNSAPAPLAELKRPETVTTLEEIISFQPRFLSVRFLHAIASGTAPRHLSVGSSMKWIEEQAGPVIHADRKKHPLTVKRNGLALSAYALSWEALAAGKGIINPACSAYLRELMILARMLDRWCGRVPVPPRGGPVPDPLEVVEQTARVMELRKAVKVPQPAVEK